MKTKLRIISALLLLLYVAQGWSQGWTGSLESGGVVKMDPTTNRATVYSDSGATQLWDGTHRMQDGSVVIVRDGIVTSGPNVQSQTPGTPPRAEPGMTLASSACVELVIKVCGFNGECRNAEPCSPARQLMQLEKDESWQTRSQGPNKTSAQCRQALDSSDYFARCDIKKPSTSPSACESLVNQVCGNKNQCADSEACAAATQLLSMETQERLISRRPERPTYTSNKCRKLDQGSGFFTRCEALQIQDPAADDGNDSETPQ